MPRPAPPPSQGAIAFTSSMAVAIEGAGDHTAHWGRQAAYGRLASPDLRRVASAAVEIPINAAPSSASNVDPATVAGFGLEWSRYDQTALSDAELRMHFDGYFAVFPWGKLPPHAAGLDVGCGTGRWARLVAERVGALHCVDASPEALEVARRNLNEHTNCVFHNATVENIPVEDGSMDFAYSLGVLHHVPDTRAALRTCVSKLKPGAPLLLYLYYDFENRP